MKKHIVYFGTLICLILALTGCKKKEEKSQNLPYRKRNFVFGNFINYHGSYLEGYRRFIRCKSRLWYEFPATDIYIRWL